MVPNVDGFFTGLPLSRRRKGGRIHLIDKVKQSKAAEKRLLKKQENLQKKLLAAKRRTKEFYDKRNDFDDLFSNVSSIDNSQH